MKTPLVPSNYVRPVGFCAACDNRRVSVLSAERELTLDAAGWFPNRRVDPYAYLDGLELSALVLHPAADDFLAEYGGLTLTPNGPEVNQDRSGKGTPS